MTTSKAPKRRDVGAFLLKLWALEALLVRAGFPPMPQWWRTEIERFYRSGKRRWVIRKGRRVFASTCVAPRLAVAEMLYGQHPHVPGTPPLVYAFLSVKKAEAGKRLIGVAAILDALGEKYSEAGDTLELRNRPAVFTVVTANFRTNVGDTVAFAWLDELARWHDDALSANPAEQVVGSLAPALSTLPDAKIIMVSTPLGTEDYHARQFDLGETATQCVSFGETWTINPSLPREACEELEPDRKLFLREYGGVPQATLTDALDADLVAFTGRARPQLTYSESVLALDASGGSTCEFASALVAYGHPARVGDPVDHTSPMVDEYGNVVEGMYELEAPGRVKRDPAGRAIPTAGVRRSDAPILSVAAMGGFTGWAGRMGIEEIYDALAAKMAWGGARIAIGDGYISEPLESAFRLRGFRFIGIPTSNTNKSAAMKHLRLLLNGKQVLLDDAETRSQLCSYRERITATGLTSYAAAAGARADRVSVILNALIGEAEGHLPWSPSWAGRRGRGDGTSPMAQHMAANGGSNALE